MVKFNYTKHKWSMRIGEFTIYQTCEYSRWRAFWLRFMGWEVKRLDNNGN